MSVATIALLPFAVASAHDGPDPIAHWDFGSHSVDGNTLKAKRGPDVTFRSPVRFVADEFGESIAFGTRVRCDITEADNPAQSIRPRDALTVAAWVAVDETQPWGGVAGVIEDNGNAEQGWVLGYDERVFTFILCTTGADDGNGHMTVLRGTTPIERGRLYHVVAVFDGTTTELFVNGRSEAETGEQWGSILYPDDGKFVIGAFRDRNEDHRLSGRIRDLKLFDLAAKPAWVQQEFEHNVQLAHLAARPVHDREGFVVEPYLQFGTQTGMTVMWQSAQPGTSVVHYGETVECAERVASDETVAIHEIRLEGLKPETQYFYAVETVLANGTIVENRPLTFSTAVNDDTPFSFVVFGDTQGNPDVSSRLAEMAWAQRPGFLVHVGDLVDRGTVTEHWTQHFFPGVQTLSERVPFYPVLGNHEENAQNYFDFMSLPEPEYYYSFRYGNTQFFMIDSNRNLERGSEQYKWLQNELHQSAATWKIVCHHHPPFSSDENDYGDLWKTNVSTRGDLRARQLTALYDEFDVDIVWNGHIHSYERTWPVRKGQAVEEDGTVYMITGGAGGGLETVGPVRPWFSNHVKHGHHYCLIAVNGGTMELKAYDLDGRLFDTVTLRKRSQADSAAP